MAETAFVAGARLSVPAASDILFAGLLIPLAFFSSPEAPDLVPSSFEASDGRDRCVPAAAGVPVAGFLAAEAAVGRAGGLLSVLPAEDRAAVVVVGVMNEEALEGVVFVPVDERFAGTPVLVAGCELGEAAGSATEGVSSVEAMVCRRSSPTYKMLETCAEKRR